jgi:hypothetical protein
MVFDTILLIISAIMMTVFLLSAVGYMMKRNLNDYLGKIEDLKKEYEGLQGKYVKLGAEISKTTKDVQGLTVIPKTAVVEPDKVPFKMLEEPKIVLERQVIDKPIAELQEEPIQSYFDEYLIEAKRLEANKKKEEAKVKRAYKRKIANKAVTARKKKQTPD